MQKAFVFALFVLLAVFVAAPTFHDTLRSMNEENTIAFHDIFASPPDESGGVALKDIIKSSPDETSAPLVGDRKPVEVAESGIIRQVVELVCMDRPVDVAFVLMGNNSPTDNDVAFTMFRNSGGTEVALETTFNRPSDPDGHTAIDEPSDGECAPTPIDVCIPWEARPSDPDEAGLARPAPEDIIV